MPRVWVKSEQTEKSLNVTEIPRRIWIEFHSTFRLGVQGTKIKFYRQQLLFLHTQVGDYKICTNTGIGKLVPGLMRNLRFFLR